MKVAKGRSELESRTALYLSFDVQLINVSPLSLQRGIVSSLIERFVGGKAIMESFSENKIMHFNGTEKF